jgi:hypothetical protein
MKTKLEEAADNWVRKPIIGTRRECFIAGAKWQQQEILQMLKDNDYQNEPVFEFFSEQFKKK